MAHNAIVTPIMSVVNSFEQLKIVLDEDRWKNIDDASFSATDSRFTAECIRVRAPLGPPVESLLPQMMARPLFGRLCLYVLGAQFDARADKIAQSAMRNVPREQQPSLGILYFETPSICTIVESIKVAFRDRQKQLLLAKRSNNKNAPTPEFPVVIGLLTSDATDRTWTVSLGGYGSSDDDDSDSGSTANNNILKLVLRGFGPDADSKIIAAFVSTFQARTITISSDMGDGQLPMVPIADACCQYKSIRSIRIDGRTADSELTYLVQRMRYMPRLERVAFYCFRYNNNVNNNTIDDNDDDYLNYGHSLYEAVHDVLADDPNTTGIMGHSHLTDIQFQVLSNSINRSLSRKNPHEIEFYLHLNDRGYRCKLPLADVVEIVEMIDDSFHGDIFDAFDVSAAYYILRHDPGKWC